MNIRPNQLAVATMALLAMIGFIGAGALIGASQEDPVNYASNTAEQASAAFIVQAHSSEQAARLVRAVGGEVTHELPIINGVGARLVAKAVASLRSNEHVKSIFADGAVTTASVTAGVDYLQFPSVVGADDLHAEGVTGRSVTVAVMDSGMKATVALQKDSDGVTRTQMRYNAIKDTAGSINLDKYGHGSHVSSIIFNSHKSLEANARFNSVAPDVRVVEVKAFNATGTGNYADVIRGLDWILANKDTYNIRVLNMSFSAEARSHYWDDPINQAVMRLWQAGVVIVASAGNRGPDPMTIGVPGNNPYVITVGAFTDNYTYDDPSDDRLATFSSAGPTYEGFVKPDVVAPGGHITGLTRSKSQLAKNYPQFHYEEKYFEMSGTSQAAAVVTGIVALTLDVHPWMTPDQVKCQLMATALPAVDDTGAPAYSMFQQGAGQVDAYGAVHNLGDLGCGNPGLNINLDVAGSQHYGGPAYQDANGDYAIEGMDGYLWRGGLLGGDGYLWGGRAFNDGYLWGGRAFNDGYLWSGGRTFMDGYLWGGRSFLDGYLWSGQPAFMDGYLWSGVEPMSVNVWVDQE